MKKKVLIVEDDQLLAYLLEQYVVNCNCEVVGSVDNGEDAVSFVKENTPDFILMDIRIDGSIDGIETAILVNEIKDVKIIYISGNSDEKTYSRAVNTNMLAFLVKPIKQNELNKLLA
jgi:two-component SAPR family response regulator